VRDEESNNEREVAQDNNYDEMSPDEIYENMNLENDDSEENKNNDTENDEENDEQLESSEDLEVIDAENDEESENVTTRGGRVIKPPSRYGFSNLQVRVNEYSNEEARVLINIMQCMKKNYNSHNAIP